MATPNIDMSNNSFKQDELVPTIRGFKIASLNITSLPKHIDELRIAMKNNEIDVLAINESRMDSSIAPEIITIHGYNWVSKDRNRFGGGVGFYIRNTINYCLRPDLNDRDLEILTIEIIKNKVKPFLVTTWYRPPSDSINILYKFENCLKLIDNEDKESIILGDINCDLLGNNTTSLVSELKFITNLYQYEQLIKEPTRVTKDTSSLIDHFYTTNTNHIISSGVTAVTISDHYLIYGIRKFKTFKQPPRFIEYRDFKHFNEQGFMCDLASLSTLNLAHSDPNKSWMIWKKKFLEIVNMHAPLKRRKVSSKQIPWLTNDLLLKKREKTYLKRKAVLSKSMIDWSAYRHARNRYNKLVKDTVRSHFQNKLHNNQGDLKKTWKTINELMNKSKKENTILEVRIDSLEITDPINITNAFNKHFVEMGDRLSKDKPQSNVTPESYLSDFQNPINQFTCFREITETEILGLLQGLVASKASGIDGISAKILKIAAPAIAPSIVLIFNQSISTGIFPSDWKIARVTPIYKTGAKHDMENYRPISVISIVAKIMEKLIHNQLYDYLIASNLLTNSQHGFRPCHSTTTALLDITNRWYQNMDVGQLNGVVFLDLKKAFDTVDHDILLKKLRIYGIKGMALRWLRSYLLDRIQYCQVNGHLSDPLTATTGIPQGSGLGPLLFLIYINDFPKCLRHTRPDMFADDTQIATSNSDINVILENLNTDLINVSTWMLANKLTLNNKKTEFMIIGSNKRLSQIDQEPSIFVGGMEIEKVNAVKSLGLMIDETLSWSAQVEKITKKVNSGLSIIRRLRDIVDYNTLITIYKSIIQPHFDYCSQVWGCLGKVLSDKLQRLQNRAFRIITREGYETRSKDILNKVGFPDLKTRREQQLATLMYKIKHKMLPNYLQDIFINTQEVHHHNTRHREFNYALPMPNTNAMKKSFGYRGAETWNTLPVDLKSLGSMTTFKSKIKQLYL